MSDPERLCATPDFAGAMAIGLTLWTVLVFVAGTCLGALVVAWALQHP